MNNSHIHYAINIRGGFYPQHFPEQEDISVYSSSEIAKMTLFQMEADYEIWMEFGQPMRDRTMTKAEYKKESHDLRKHYRDMDMEVESQSNII